MSKKRPTESSWDSDEELLSDTAGISAFPKTSELDLLAEDGELDEEALLGLDDSGAAYSNDAMQPMVNRQRSKNAISAQQDPGPLAEQAFVFEVADTGDLEDELTGNEAGNEMLGTYSNEGMDPYSHEIYDQNGSGALSHEVSAGENQDIYSSNMLSTTEDSKDHLADQGDYVEVDAQSGQVYSDEQSGHYHDVADAEGHLEDSTNVELGYDHPEQQIDQVHLEYEQEISSDQLGAEQAEGHTEKAYESDSDSDEDSRHNRGKFKSERTGVISLSATTEREAIPDTLEINDEQAAQIQEFMSDKPQRGKGRGGGRNNRGRQSAHSRLGNRSGMGPPQPGQGGMFGERTRMMNPRFQSPPGPRGGPGMPPRGLMSPRPLFGGMRQGGPVMGGLFNPMFAGARGPQGGGRFPGGPVGPMIGPGALLEPMKQLLQRMRGPHPGAPRMAGPGILQRPDGPLGMRMTGPASMRGGHEPRLFAGTGPNRMMRPPQQLLSPPQGSPILGPRGIQPPPNMLGQPRQANRGRVPPHQRLGQAGAANRGLMSTPRGLMRGGLARGAFAAQQGRLGANNKIFINPLFQGQQGGPTGLTRTVKMGAPVHQKKAKALLEKAKQTQIKQASTSVVAVKRKSTGGDDVAAKVVRKEEEQEESVRTVEKQEPMEQDSKKMTSLLEEQKRKRELIQKRKELARQKLAEEKRKELEQKQKTEGNKIESIVGGNSSSSDERKVEKSGDAAPIKVVSRSMASRLGPPPASAQKVQLQGRGPPQQQIRGPQFQQQVRGPHSLQVRGPMPPQMRGPQLQHMRTPQPQQMRGPQPQLMRGPQSQQMRGPQPQQLRNPPPQPRGNQPQQFRGIAQQTGSYQVQQTQGIQQRLGVQHQQQQLSRGPPPQQMRGPPPGSQQQVRSVISQHTIVPQPHHLAGPPPHQVRGQPPQQIGGPPQLQQPRGPPPQQMRGPPPQQNVRCPLPQQLRGPPPQQNAAPQFTRPAAPMQFNPQVAQIRGPPPGGSQMQAQPPPSSVGYQALPPAAPAQPRFVAPSQFQQHQQPPHSGYDAGVPPSPSLFPGGIATRPPPAQPQVHQFSGPPPQQPHSNPQYPPAIPPSNTGDAHNYNPSFQGNTAQPPPSYNQQSYPPQPEYTYSDASSAPSHQPAAPAYQYNQPEPQSYAGGYYENEQAAPAYPSTSQSQQHYPPPQHQAQTNIPQSQDTSYLPSTAYYSSPQPIQTIQTVSNQSANPSAQSQHQSPVGQKIQTIGQRIQPVTGTQMRSIIHNVASPPQSSTPARSVQHRTPTLHISRAVMEGNVPTLPGSQKVIILNVPQMATRETLIRLCRHFGHVEGVNLMRDQNKAVVQFQKGEQAAKCVSKCDQKCLHKTRLTVKLLPS